MDDYKTSKAQGRDRPVQGEDVESQDSGKPGGDLGNNGVEEQCFNGKDFQRRNA